MYKGTTSCAYASYLQEKMLAICPKQDMMSGIHPPALRLPGMLSGSRLIMLCHVDVPLAGRLHQLPVTSTVKSIIRIPILSVSAWWVIVAWVVGCCSSVHDSDIGYTGRWVRTSLYACWGLPRLLALTRRTRHLVLWPGYNVFRNRSYSGTSSGASWGAIGRTPRRWWWREYRHIHWLMPLRGSLPTWGRGPSVPVSATVHSSGSPSRGHGGISFHDMDDADQMR